MEAGVFCALTPIVVFFFLSENMARHVHQLSGDVYRNTDPIPEDTPKIQGYNFNQGVDHRALLQSYLTTGLQATNVGFGYPADQQHGEMGGTQGEFR